MDDFFEELDSELGTKKPEQKAKTQSSQKKGGTQKRPSSSAPAKKAPPTTNSTSLTKRKSSAIAKKAEPGKLTLKKSPNMTKGKLRLKQERVSTPKVSTASTRAGVKGGGGRARARTISSPSIFPKLTESVTLPPLPKGSTRIVPIGGLRTVGANMNMVQFGDEILLVDGGLEFARDNAPGADCIIPDMRFLIAQSKKIKGMFVTHGHLDHIGGLKNMIPALGFPPIYGAPFTIAMIKKIFAEVGILNKCKFITINPDAKKLATLGSFTYEFFRVNHTIPDSCGVYIETPSTKIMHMGDYKIDFSPRLDKPADLSDYARIASRGIDFLLQETTNSARAEWTTTESKISGQLKQIIMEAKDRVIVGNFSTLLSRIQDVIKISEDLGKYVFISGRSMVDHVAIAREMGLLKCKAETIKTLDPKTLSGVPEQRQVIIATGAQGEEYGGLGLMSRGDHRAVKIKPRDTIVLSSSVIPGNEVPIRNMVNDLNRFGPKIITIKEQEVHSGGHGGIAEQRVIMNLVKPRFIIPCHGDLTARLTLKKEAVAMGYDPKTVLILEDGALIEMDAKKQLVNTRKKLPLKALVVDGQGIGVMKSTTIRDRQTLANEGCLMIVFPAGKTGSLRVESRGVFFQEETVDAHKQIAERVKKMVTENKSSDAKALGESIAKDLGKFVLQKWGREPVVVPMGV